MRVLTYLTRRYPPGQSLWLVIPALVVLLGARFAAFALGVAQPVATAVSFALGIAVAFGAATVINRRTTRT